MTPAPRHKKATDIPVHGFRMILHWPLTLASPPEDLETAVGEARAALAGGNWTQEDPWTLVGATPKGGPYEEFVYFHDFVQGLLYRRIDGEETNAAPIRLYRRDDVEALDATVGGRLYRFQVGMLALHLFQAGTAIMTLELIHEPGAGSDLTLAETQTVIDYLRRAYPGYWQDDGTTAGLCPSDVVLMGAGGVPIGAGEPVGGRVKATEWARERRVPRVFHWWRALLAPLRLKGEDGRGPDWRHILDERLPLMTWLSLSGASGGTPADDLALVSPGDWMRIAAADAAGDANMPYNATFLTETLGATAFYDRFFPGPGMAPDQATRYLFAGYHLAMVGAGPRNGAFSFFDDIVAEHFRRHYRQMVFLALLEFATLLAFSSRITALVADTIDRSDDFRRRLQRIEEDFLQFTHLHRFTNVSNHLQAKEMFTKLRHSLQLDELYEDVRQEIKSAVDFSFAQQQSDQTRATQRLTEVATLGLPAALAVGAAGMNVLVGSDTLDVSWLGGEPGSASRLWTDLFQLSACGAAFYSLMFLTISPLRRSGGAVVGWLRPATFTVAVVCALAAVVFAAVPG